MLIFYNIDKGIISVKKAAGLMDMEEVEGDLNRIFTDIGLNEY